MAKMEFILSLSRAHVHTAWLCCCPRAHAKRTMRVGHLVLPLRELILNYPQQLLAADCLALLHVCTERRQVTHEPTASRLIHNEARGRCTVHCSTAGLQHLCLVCHEEGLIFLHQWLHRHLAAAINLHSAAVPSTSGMHQAALLGSDGARSEADQGSARTLSTRPTRCCPRLWYSTMSISSISVLASTAGAAALTQRLLSGLAASGGAAAR